ncbi:YbaB/EbfC family nucleoid-associated protein [Glycomyces sp. YM15]|uniref:YbaB/EbfC family nucleoid-associated protein n=1 Tax=Glycomyces sp. YM15 TaxID=2800446 RepID=UPI001964016B|nr:YbaB/EbfC family nucleoid-associated protein [Glycomyces sp. YM15]
MRTPEEIMQDLEHRVAVIQEQASRAEQALAASETTLAGDEGAVHVTVNAGGALTGLRFSNEAKHMSGTGLAELVLDTYKRAVEESGRKTAEIMSDLLGGDPEAMGLLQSFTAPKAED